MNDGSKLHYGVHCKAKAWKTKKGQDRYAGEVLNGTGSSGKKR